MPQIPELEAAMNFSWQPPILIRYVFGYLCLQDVDASHSISYTQTKTTL